jgi:hypothetical protein
LHTGLCDYFPTIQAQSPRPDRLETHFEQTWSLSLCDIGGRGGADSARLQIWGRRRRLSNLTVETPASEVAPFLPRVWHRANDVALLVEEMYDSRCCFFSSWSAEGVERDRTRRISRFAPRRVAATGLVTAFRRGSTASVSTRHAPIVVPFTKSSETGIVGA